MSARAKFRKGQRLRPNMPAIERELAAFHASQVGEERSRAAAQGRPPREIRPMGGGWAAGDRLVVLGRAGGGYNVLWEGHDSRWLPGAFAVPSLGGEPLWLVEES